MQERQRIPRTCKFCDKPATKIALAQPVGYPCCDDHVKKAKALANRIGDGPARTKPIEFFKPKRESMERLVEDLRDALDRWRS